MTTELRSASLSDVGLARERNEDACYAGNAVFAVADGLGGHRAGEVASNLALDSVIALDRMEPKKAAHHVADAVRKGNKAVFDRSQQDAGLKGMGTTMTAVVIHDGVAHIAHVGDSRAYLVRGDAITQLSHDHTLVARMVSEGKLTPEQAEVHPQRSILTRALGNESHVDVEEVNVPLVAGDRLLLCSDGLSGVLSPDEIRRLASDGADLDEICRGMIAEANARGGPDNITVVLVDVVRAPARATPSHGERARPPRDRRRVPARAIVWTVIVLTVVLGGFVGVRAWADRSFYVGVDGDRVAIYRGLPVEFLGVSLSEVEEPTDIEVADVRQQSVRRSLHDGIRASTLEQARAIVANQIEPLAEPEPTPTKKASPTGSASPTGKASP